MMAAGSGESMPVRRSPSALPYLLLATLAALATLAPMPARTQALDPAPLLDDAALDARVEILADPDGSLAPLAALQRLRDGHGGPPPALERRGGLRHWWLRLTLPEAASGQAMVLRVARYWQEVVLFDSAGAVRGRAGSAVPLAARSLGADVPVLLLPPGQAELLLRFSARFDGYLAPLRFLDALEEERGFQQRLRRFELLNGIYAGVILALAAFNLFLAISLRDRVYAWYVLYALSFGAIWIVRAGIGLQLAWPAWPGWNSLASFFLIALAIASGNRFVQVFLDLPRTAPRAHQALHGVSVLVLLTVLAGLAGFWQPATTALALLALLSSLAYFGIGLRALQRGYLPARFFLLACSALIFGVIAYVGAWWGLLPTVFVTIYGAQIGSALEVLLLAFALGDRINLLKREKLAAESRLRGALEVEVGARTAELAERSHQVEQANARLREANTRLQAMSRIDGLTGVANRRRFEEHLDQEWRRMLRAGRPLSVLLFDADRFKDLNDRHGHLAGDEALRRIAACLAAGARRPGDLVARFGGEEFAMGLADTDVGAAQARADALRERVSTLQLVDHAGRSFSVAVSAGVSGVTPGPGLDPQDLLHAADLALYAAKRAGRNRVHARAPARRTGEAAD